MTEEFRAFRILLVPLVLLIVFFIIPAMCRHKAPAPAEQANAAQTSDTAAPPSGLRIEGAPVRPVAASSANYPPGLDAARVQYLVEIDSQFSQPKTAVLSKTRPDQVTSTLRRLGYIETAPDGKVTLSREGLLNLNASDQGDNYVFPIAKRVFETVTHVSRVEDDKYDVTFSWRYEPTPVGTNFAVDKNRHSATAQFINGPSGWAFGRWVAPPAD